MRGGFNDAVSLDIVETQLHVCRCHVSSMRSFPPNTIPLKAHHAHAFTVDLTISQLPLHLSAVMVAYAKVISNLTHDLVPAQPEEDTFFWLVCNAFKTTMKTLECEEP